MNQRPGSEILPPEIAELVRKSEGLPLLHLLRTLLEASGS